MQEGATFALRRIFGPTMSGDVYFDGLLMIIVAIPGLGGLLAGLFAARRWIVRLVVVIAVILSLIGVWFFAASTAFYTSAGMLYLWLAFVVFPVSISFLVGLWAGRSYSPKYGNTPD